ncbi:MAG: 16S rRNA (adenine(1518)-N(6)/adenine(1519)-N(6))-dimethyltransferase RsmA [bacterium]
MTSLSVHALLKKYNIAPKKRLGQHFLAAMPTMEKIVAALDVGSQDAVIEIGPGLGLMTRLVALRARQVIAIDRDRALLDIARSELADIENIAWVEGDILEQTIEGIAAAGRCPGIQRFKLIGNLPYNISSPILFWMLDSRQHLSQAIIMMQKEVALRIASRPGCKDYGILSVITQAFAKAERLFDVSAKSFVPPPKVTSSVLRIDFTAAARVEPQDEARFREVVRAAFGKRRKTIRNALLGARGLRITADLLDQALKTTGIDPVRRPETLSIDEFAMLSEHLGRSK